MDGIGHPKKRAFLAAYAQLGNVTQAAKAADIGRSTHYEWMSEEGPEGDAYREAFRLAEEEAADHLEAEARRRAVEGVDEPVFYHGQQVATVRRYSDTLLIFLLKGALPEKYAERTRAEISGPGGDPIRMSMPPDEVAALKAFLADMKALEEGQGGDVA